MKHVKPTITHVILFAALGLLTACGAEVGSKEWCEKMKGENLSELSMQDAEAYAEHCAWR